MPAADSAAASNRASSSSSSKDPALLLVGAVTAKVHIAVVHVAPTWGVKSTRGTMLHLPRLLPFTLLLRRVWQISAQICWPGLRRTEPSNGHYNNLP